MTNAADVLLDFMEQSGNLAEVLSSAERAYTFARSVLRHPWPDAEAVIAQEPHWAYRYARDVLRRRWLEAEPVIAQNRLWATAYRGRFGVDVTYSDV